MKPSRCILIFVTGAVLILLLGYYFDGRGAAAYSAHFGGFGLANEAMALIYSHEAEPPESLKIDDLIALLNNKESLKALNGLAQSMIEQGVIKVNLYICDDLSVLKAIYAKRPANSSYVPIVVEVTFRNKIFRIEKVYIIRDIDNGPRAYSEQEFNQKFSLKSFRQVKEFQ